MEWIKDYWFAVVVVLIVAMFLFGHKTKGDVHEQQNASDSVNKGRKGGGGGVCCH